MAISQVYRDDVRWVYEQFSAIAVKDQNGDVVLDVEKASRPPPNNSAIGVAQWAIEHQREFYALAPRVLTDDGEEDKPGGKPALRRQLDVTRIDELLATVTDLHGIDQVVNATVADKIRQLLRRVQLRLSHEFELRSTEQKRKMAKWKAEQNQRAFEVAEMELRLLGEIAEKVHDSLEEACGTFERSCAAPINGGEPAVPASAERVGESGD